MSQENIEILGRAFRHLNETGHPDLSLYDREVVLRTRGDGTGRATYAGNVSHVNGWASRSSAARSDRRLPQFDDQAPIEETTMLRSSGRKTQPWLDFIPVRATGLEARGVGLRGPTAVGALAIGATAFGAAALGALAIGRLAIGQAMIKRLVIEDLDVRRLHVQELDVVTDRRTPSA